MNNKEIINGYEDVYENLQKLKKQYVELVKEASKDLKEVLETNKKLSENERRRIVEFIDEHGWSYVFDLKMRDDLFPMNLVDGGIYHSCNEIYPNIGCLTNILKIKDFVEKHNIVAELEKIPEVHVDICGDEAIEFAKNKPTKFALDYDRYIVENIHDDTRPELFADRWSDREYNNYFNCVSAMKHWKYLVHVIEKDNSFMLAYNHELYLMDHKFNVNEYAPYYLPGVDNLEEIVKPYVKVIMEDLKERYHYIKGDKYCYLSDIPQIEIAFYDIEELSMSFAHNTREERAKAIDIEKKLYKLKERWESETELSYRDVKKYVSELNNVYNNAKDLSTLEDKDEYKACSIDGVMKTLIKQERANDDDCWQTRDPYIKEKLYEFENFVIDLVSGREEIVRKTDTQKEKDKKQLEEISK